MLPNTSSSRQLAAAAVVVGLIFLVIAAVYASGYSHRPRQHLPPPRLADVSTIEDWMTVHYVAVAYAVPEQRLLDALHVNAQQSRRQSLADIARAQHTSPDQILAIVRSEVQQYQQNQSPTPVGFGRRRLPALL
jgi:hypothetical protein